MFSPKLFASFTRLYTYPCSRLTFLMPLNCKSSIRKLAVKNPTAISYGRKSTTKTKGAFTNSVKTSHNMSSKRKAFVPRTFSNEYATSTTNPKVSSTFSSTPKAEPRTISAMDGMKEFFSHPLTWDRNNGYINILLGLAIFGYSFCTTCSGETTSGSKVTSDYRGNK